MCLCVFFFPCCCSYLMCCCFGVYPCCCCFYSSVIVKQSTATRNTNAKEKKTFTNKMAENHFVRRQKFVYVFGIVPNLPFAKHLVSSAIQNNMPNILTAYREEPDAYKKASFWGCCVFSTISISNVAFRI